MYLLLFYVYVLFYVHGGTLIEAASYIALDEHDHINVGEQLKSYACMF